MKTITKHTSPQIEFIKCHIVLDEETDRIADDRAAELKTNRSKYIRDLIVNDMNRAIARKMRQELRAQSRVIA